MAGAALRPARAQQSALPVVAFLDSTSAAARTSRIAAFRKGLSEAGIVEGRNAAIEFHFAENQLDRVPGIVGEVVGRRVAVIHATGPFVQAAKAATSTIPIVFISGADPLESGMVPSLNRPGGNVTGVSFTSSPLDPKRLELLSELIPRTATIGALMDFVSSVQPAAATQRALETAAASLGRKIVIVRATTERDLDAAFETIVQSGAGALFVGTGPFYLGKRRQLVALAARHALPASFAQRDYVEAGGLMSYGASDIEASRRPQFRRPHSERGEAKRSAGRTADAIRVGVQPRNRQSAQGRYSGEAARACGRGDRVTHRQGWQ